MAVMANHHAPDDPALAILTDQNIGTRTGSGEPKIRSRIIVANDKTGGAPEGDDHDFIL